MNKWYKIKRKQDWLQRQQDWKNGILKEDTYIGNMLMQKYMIQSNGVHYSVRGKSKSLRNQLKYLKQYECEIINKLRTECINLNGYKKYKFDESSGKCIYCNVEETVEHFLLKCKGSKNEYANYHNECEIDYDLQRDKLRKELKKHAIFFKESKNFNVINILFPNIWQVDPKKTNPDYHEIKEKNRKREINILKCVVRFVQNTKRFKKEKYGL